MEPRMQLVGKLIGLIVNETIVKYVIIRKIPSEVGINNFRISIFIYFGPTDNEFTKSKYHVVFPVPSDIWVESVNIDIDEQANYFFKSIMEKINKKLLA